jgi:hemoglobin
MLGGMTETQAPDTIFDRIGGEAAVEAVVEIFYGKVLGDPELKDYFAATDIEGLKRHQSRFVGMALGATRPYSGRSMQKAHEGMGITEADFNLVVGHLAAALTEAGVDGPTIEAIAEKLVPLKGDIVTA